MTFSIDLSLLAILSILYFTSILGVIGTVLSENRNPLKASAWVVIVGFIPIVGLGAYLIFGQDQRRLHRISRRFYRRLMRHPLRLRLPVQEVTRTSLPDSWQQLTEMVERSSDNPLLAIDEIEVFTEGAAMYDSLIRDIDQARQHIHLQSYIFEDDSVFDLLRTHLLESRARGVDVRIIYDHLGSYAIDRRKWRALRRAGIQAYPFLPVHLPLLSSTVNYRNHRKVAVIDGEVGYVGGMNFARRYLEGTPQLGPWRDTHFRLRGDAVAALQSAFLLDWYVVSRRVVSMESFFPRGKASEPGQGTSMVQFILGGPMDEHPQIEQAIINLINRARRHVKIQTPYFLPTEPLNRAIIMAALSGVEISLMIPDRGDSRFTSLAVDSYLAPLIRVGVRVYRYRRGFLHSKLLMVDGQVAAIGSANMDFRSFEHNFEITGIVYSPTLTAELEAIYERDCADSCLMELDAWERRSASRRMVESTVRLFSPLL